jgi:glycosyltransferase involved in cell wall biosynthesis
MSEGRRAGLEVDIVISNHDYGAFVTDAIESACRQTHPGVNVIVVDDGSTDNSREVLRRFEDRVEIVLKENGGQASALNAGIARCRGEVVMFLDADDMLRPHAAERVAECFADDPGLAKVQFRLAVTDAGGRATGAVKPNPHLPLPSGDLRRAELAFPFDIGWLPGGGTAFRAEALRRILPIPEHDYPGYGADWYVVHLTALLGRAAALDEVLADYRVHGRNGYELQEPRLNLAQLRDAIAYEQATIRALTGLADELGLERPDPILSLSNIADRLVSLRLEPELHPIAGDRVGALLGDAVRATRRRFDRSWLVKALLLCWFLAFAVSPRPLARWLADLLLFPQRRRGGFNRLLGRLYGARGNTAPGG